ncbi:nucleoside-diphosphate sugar epimerase/dehydratase [Anoxynatronum buryatiense]|uniref:NDP-sugar epimerase, includes UDP-GlcNAc-inverting 4,6-dehydratase FlaA1 and capsular polysaccharide biosynthesis protein EpsC n=1 Tax=Anoxynatronum buryatiense TaxID=489973 RepID=A0AA46AJ39_9CLOT|nr:nucleoside-diphosphate sugar epimerase/dehydratase [Anoxynatronum buryatiense]SMP57023.1 NDP-sugar epimerase, includes UDP-GlcNAc-inverting 4,6-dehydratase FlaA1 and capsular polysaccharide biosynthesis protein EpsC [Anoxynatronum buryatiense]
MKLTLQMKKGVLLVLDALLIQLVYLLAFAIRFDYDFSGRMVSNYWPVYRENLLWILLIKLAVFYLLGLYHSLWRYASIEELMKVAITAVLANASVMAYLAITQQMLPRGIHALAILLDMALIGGVRFAYRVSRTYRDTGFLTFNPQVTSARRVLIVGAGEAGAMVVKELKAHGYQHGRPVGIVDDDKSKIGRKLAGVTVLGSREKLPELIKSKRVDEVILAMPSVQRQVMREVIDVAAGAGVRLKTVPGVYELIDGQVSIKEIRDVDIEDLLGREPVDLDLEAIAGFLKGKKVLVTGGGGSIGSELCRQIADFAPRELLMLDIYENHLYELQQELRKKHPQLTMKVLVGSVRDKACMQALFQREQPTVVFHAAAHKHVPLMEDSPAEAVKNNVMGTRNVAWCAHEAGCEKLVLISTDKAVNPTNVMGASKRLAEMVVQSLDEISQTEFAAVRFGNVLGSSGSVIPLFKKQIEDGGPVTVTHEDMTRYFMTIPEAVQLVIQAGAMARGGEVFVLDMGDPVKIMDLAENLIRLSGFTPGEDIQVEVTGLRPGEKLYEELLLDSNGLEATVHQKIFVEKPAVTAFETLNQQVDELAAEICMQSPETVKAAVARLVTTYTPQ